jgi:hypothetical protein
MLRLQRNELRSQQFSVEIHGRLKSMLSSSYQHRWAISPIPHNKK